MASTYQIADEPSPGRFAPYTVSTHWAFMASVVGGSWLGLPWFLFNSRAVGSATRRRETTLIVIAPLVTALVGAILLGAIDALHVDAGEMPSALTTILGLPKRSVSYAVVLLYAIKFAFLYAIQDLQSKSVEIHEHFGRPVRSGALIVGAGYLLRPLVMSLAFQVSPWLGFMVM